MIAVICLATIDIGNVFWQKRELQKIADLAALAGASGALDQSSCRANAERNLTLNGSVVSELVTAQPGVGTKAPAPSLAAPAGPAKSMHAGCLFRGRCRSCLSLPPEPKEGARYRPRHSNAVGQDRQTIRAFDPVDTGYGKVSPSGCGRRRMLEARSIWALPDGRASPTNISLLSFFDALAVRAGLNVGDYDQVVKTKVTLDKVMLVRWMPCRSKAVCCQCASMHWRWGSAIFRSRCRISRRARASDRRL
jgi:hypothetical protein